jgi:Ca-activated chloride channel family protein
MRRIDEHEIERHLAEDRIPSPPADLAARIKAEIPGELPSLEGYGGTVTPFHPRSGRRLLLAAAGVVIVVGSGLITWRLLPPEAGRIASEQASAPPLEQPAKVETAAKKGGKRDETSAAQGRKAAIAEIDAAAVPGRAPGEGAVSGGSAGQSGSAALSRDSRTGPTSAAAPSDMRLARAQTAARPGTVAVGVGPLPVRPGEASRTDAEAGRSMPEGELAPKEAEEQRRYEQLKKLQMSYSNLVAGAPAPVTSGGKDEIDSPKVRIARLAPTTPRVPHSTGGTTEPNDRPYGDVFFQHYGVNPFIDTEDDALSTFGLDVDTGSYTVARRYLSDGNLPDPASVRVEEYLNYFKYGAAPPRRGDFAITAEGAPTPFAKGDRYRVLRFGIHAREIDTTHRKPAVLTFVVDVSGSMAREDRLGLVKKALFALLDQLRPGDEVALVVYGSRGRVLLEPTSDREAVRFAIDRLTPGGSTNAEEGLVLGYDLAARAFRRDGINRVILCSDGVANVGRTGPDSILGRIEREAQRGIELTTVGFGMGNYNDVLLEQLADRGNGRYAYVDTFREARRIFVENLTGTLQTIAVNAKVQVEFNPKVVARYRLLGYENRDIEDRRFRDDTVDAGEIGAGHVVTALYEIKLQERPPQGQPVATLRLRYRPEAGGEFVEVAHEVGMNDIAASWGEASPALRLATLVAEFAEILKGAYWAKEGDLGDVFRRAQRLLPSFPGDADVAEFVALVGTAARLKAPVSTPVEPREEDAPPARR